MLVGDDDGLKHVFFCSENWTDLIQEGWDEYVHCFKEPIKQLEEYFTGERQEFDLLLNPEGTEFQLAVWDELCKIPYGATRSYSEIAKAIGNPKASRAVGQANNKNPLPIIIPCHRVIGANGEMVGFSSGIEIKKKLLEFEQKHVT